MDHRCGYHHEDLTLVVDSDRSADRSELRERLAFGRIELRERLAIGRTDEIMCLVVGILVRAADQASGAYATGDCQCGSRYFDWSVSGAVRRPQRAAPNLRPIDVRHENLASIVNANDAEIACSRRRTESGVRVGLCVRYATNEQHQA